MAQSNHPFLLWWRKLQNHFVPTTARQTEDVWMALVYAIRISQQMIVQLLFTKYRRFFGKSDVNCHLNSEKKSNKATLHLISNFTIVSAMASGYYFGDCIRNPAILLLLSVPSPEIVMSRIVKDCGYYAKIERHLYSRWTLVTAMVILNIFISYNID